MKKIFLFGILVILLTTSSCEVIKKIFKGKDPEPPNPNGFTQEQVEIGRAHV